MPQPQAQGNCIRAADLQSIAECCTDVGTHLSFRESFVRSEGALGVELDWLALLKEGEGASTASRLSRRRAASGGAARELAFRFL